MNHRDLRYIIQGLTEQFALDIKFMSDSYPNTSYQFYSYLGTLQEIEKYVQEAIKGLKEREDIATYEKMKAAEAMDAAFNGSPSE